MRLGERRDIGIIAGDAGRERRGCGKDVRCHAPHERAPVLFIENWSQALLRMVKRLDRHEYPFTARPRVDVHGLHAQEATGVLERWGSRIRNVGGRRLCVLGGGSWGTAIASVAAVDVVLWTRRPEVAAEVNETRRNQRYTGDIELPATLVATASLEEACKDALAVLVAVPSSVFRAVMVDAAAHLPFDAPLLSLTKGIERGSNLTMTQVLSSCVQAAAVGVITGPNLAKEIVAGMPAACVIALRDEGLAKVVQSRLHTPRLRVYTSTDVVGCEVAGATKNVLAIAAGVSDGLGFGDNTRAAIITRGLAEMGRLGVALGGQPLTFGGLAGVGDLVATCTSDKSRNRRIGVALGTGRTLDEAVASIGEVAEGVVSARPLVELARSQGVEVPICEQVALMIEGSTTPIAALRTLSERPAREEWDVELLRELGR